MRRIQRQCIPLADVDEDSSTTSMLLPSASQALSATEGLGHLRECAEGVSVEDDGTAFADTVVEDNETMFADAAVEDNVAMACWQHACVCASRWESNSCSASLAGS